MIISTSEPADWPIWTKTIEVSDVADNSTVTKVETRKMVATPMLSENLFFI